MLIVDGKVIETPIIEIVEKLKVHLINNKIDKLRDIERRGNLNLRITCPIHKNGQERTPSCDILLKTKSKNVVKGTVSCFGCGYKANFVKFVADCMNENYSYAKQWIIDVSEYSIAELFRDVPGLEEDEDNEIYSNIEEISLDELRGYENIHPYMFKRKLTDEIIDKFEVGYDPKTDMITFPVYFNGRCETVVKRHTRYKFFRMPKMEIKPIYGLDYITGKEVIVCEGIIDALTCWVYGREAIALLGTGSEHNYKVLNKLGLRSYILMLDNDKAGRLGVKRFKENVKNAFITDIVLPKGKDVNDLTKEEFEEYLKNSI